MHRSVVSFKAVGYSLVFFSHSLQRNRSRVASGIKGNA